MNYSIKFKAQTSLKAISSCPKFHHCCLLLPKMASPKGDSFRTLERKGGAAASWGPIVPTAEVHGSTCGLFSPRGWRQAINPPPASSQEIRAQPSLESWILCNSALNSTWPLAVLSPCFSLWWPRGNVLYLHVLPTSYDPHWGYLGSFSNCRTQTKANWQGVEVER